MSEPFRTNFKHEMPSRFDRKKLAKVEAELHERTVYREVNARDGMRCRVCGRRCDPNGLTFLTRGHHHHVTFRSAGGETATWNIALVCAECHDRVHVKRTIRIEGDADLALTFWYRGDDDVWFVGRQELSPGVYERD